MDLQVLISTMNQSDYSLLEKMNIHSNALVINQNRPLRQDFFDFQGNHVEWYSTPEKGIGNSRNTALLHAKAEVCLFADDDVVYHPEYKILILNEFKRLPDADVIIFNVGSTNPSRPEYTIDQLKKIHFYNCLRYGTFRIAVRLNRIKTRRIFFSVLFGGGSKYGSGEDNLFITDCIRKGLQIYGSPIEIGKVTHAESTWFKGYTKKFFHDKGALFCAISRKFAVPLCLQYCLRHRETLTKLTFLQAFKYMLGGIHEYENNINH